MNRPTLASCTTLLLAGMLYLKMAAFNALIAAGGYQPPEAQTMMVGLALGMALAVLLLPRTWRWAGLLAVDAFVSVVVLADTAYFRYFGEIMPMSALAYSHQALGVGASVGSLLRPEDVWLFVDLLVLLVLFPWRNVVVPVLPAFDWRAPVAALGAIAAVLATTLKDFEDRHPQALAGAWNPRYICSVIGTLPYHMIDGYFTAAVRLGGPPSDDDIEMMAAWFEERTRSRTSRPPVAAGMNLVILQVEALQGFVIDRTVGGQAITPHLNRLAKGNLYFPNLYAQTREGNTSDSEFMANTGLYPAPRGAAFVRFANNTYRALPHALKDQGYTAVAMHANAPGFWNRYLMYQRLGFDRFYNVQDYTLDETIGLGLSDRSFLAQSAEKLSGLPQPFYAWMVTMSSHHPFEVPAELAPLPLGEWENTQLGHYLRSIHYADAQIGAFMEDLERRKLADHTVVVVVGDHPAIPNEQREVLYRFLGETGTGEAAWRHLQKVPLIVSVPGLAAERREVAGGQVDLLPTLAGLYGLDFPVAFGQDLLGAPEGFVTFRDGSYLSRGTLQAADAGEDVARSRQHFALSARILQADLVPTLHERLTRLSSFDPVDGGRFRVLSD